MNTKVVDFAKNLQAVEQDCRRFCFMSRGREFQLASIEQLDQLRGEAEDLKNEMVVQLEDEEAANAMLSYIYAIQSVALELKMWVALKDDQAVDAWGHLVEAQNCARWAGQAYPGALDVDNVVRHLDVLERVLFPPQLFSSPAMLIRSSECSICGEDYAECPHVVGRAYMGEPCCQIIHKAELDEVSIVENPANKHCRIISFSDGDVQRDPLTWRPVSIHDTEEGT